MSKGYREFWPWFITVLFGIVVIASVVTVSIASRHGDTSLAEGYQKTGFTVNEVIAPSQRALQLGLSASLQLSSISVVLQIENTPWPTRLSLLFIHPFDKSLDHRLALSHRGQGRYLRDDASLNASHPTTGRWHLLLNDPDDSWVLKAQVQRIESPIQANTSIAFDSR